MSEPTPVSEIFYEGGHMARLFSDGWHCTCFKPDCDHVKAAKAKYQAAGGGEKKKESPSK